METQTNQDQGTKIQGFYAEPRVFLSKDGQYVIHVLPGNMMVRKHVNFYLKVLGIEFTPKAKQKSA